MKIYTQTGDKGQTSLVGGNRVSKSSPRLDAYGTVDELCANLGLLADYTGDGDDREFLINIIGNLMVCSSSLACDNPQIAPRLPRLSRERVLELEREIDRKSEELPVVDSFTIPVGSVRVSQANVARTVCRRAERCVVRLSEISEVDPTILEYLNRLSDYLYVMTRWYNKSEGVEERLWKC